MCLQNGFIIVTHNKHFSLPGVWQPIYNISTLDNDLINDFEHLPWYKKMLSLILELVKSSWNINNEKWHKMFKCNYILKLIYMILRCINLLSLFKEISILLSFLWKSPNAIIVKHSYYYFEREKCRFSRLITRTHT